MVTVITMLACSAGGLLASPTPTATNTQPPTATSTQTPTKTPRPTLTPTPNLGLECKMSATKVYMSETNAIWGEFNKIGALADKHFANDGTLKSADGLTDLAQQVNQLADLHETLAPPTIFKTYNDESVATMRAFARILSDFASGDKARAEVDRAAFRTHYQATYDEWVKALDFCGFPTPEPSTSG